MARSKTDKIRRKETMSLQPEDNIAHKGIAESRRGHWSEKLILKNQVWDSSILVALELLAWLVSLR